MKTQGGQTVLSKKTELAFIKYINICAEWGYPLKQYDLRLLVKNYFDKLGITEKRFKDRAAISSETINEYFEQLRNSISDVPIENIVNYDETNLADDPGRKKIIT